MSLKYQMMSNEDFEIIVMLKNLRTAKCYTIQLQFWSKLAFWNLESRESYRYSTITWKTTDAKMRLLMHGVTGQDKVTYSTPKYTTLIMVLKLLKRWMG